MAMSKKAKEAWERQKYKKGQVDVEFLREAGRKGGKSKSARKIAAATLNLPWSHKKLTRQQVTTLALLKEGEFAEAVKDLIMQIVTETKTLNEKHMLLDKLLKLPFVAKVMQEYEQQQLVGPLPVVMSVLVEHDRRDLIKVINERLEKEGYWRENGEETED